MRAAELDDGGETRKTLFWDPNRQGKVRVRKTNAKSLCECTGTERSQGRRYTPEETKTRKKTNMVGGLGRRTGVKVWFGNPPKLQGERKALEPGYGQSSLRKSGCGKEGEGIGHYIGKGEDAERQDGSSGSGKGR